MPIGLCVGLLVAGLIALASWPGFFPGHVAVSGNRRVPRGEILARAAIAPHLSIWIQNSHAIASRIEAIPYIGTASVRRVPPASIRIIVTERVPFATIRSGDAVAVVDRGLRVLEPASSPDNLPALVAGPGIELVPGTYVRTADAVRLRDAYEAVAAAGVDASEVSLDRFGGLIVTRRDGLELLLGTQDALKEKLTLANAIVAQVLKGQRRVAAIDVRAPGAPVLVYR